MVVQSFLSVGSPDICERSCLFGDFGLAKVNMLMTSWSWCCQLDFKTVFRLLKLVAAVINMACGLLLLMYVTILRQPLLTGVFLVINPRFAA